MTGLVEDKALDDALALIIERLRAQPAGPGMQRRPGSLTDIARALCRERQVRAKFLPDGIMLGEPGWDILLDLYVAKRDGRPVCVSSACIASGVPPTTALRWITQLVDQRAIQREPDPNDRRRGNLCLSDETEAAIDAYLSAICRDCSSTVNP